MLGWPVVLGALFGGLSFLAWAHLRTVLGRRLEEALPECSIADLEPGRFRVLGRVVPIETSRSDVDGADCVYVERAEYRTVGLVPLLREVHHGASCHPFYLEDDSGRILVDPGRALIECATLSADGGLTAERRVRAGETVALDATFAPASDDAEEGAGPYRASARRWRPVADTSGPPRLSHRTEREMLVVGLDPISGFLGGAGGMLLVFATLIGFIFAFMS